jgi:bla regulator protein BlaR1
MTSTLLSASTDGAIFAAAVWVLIRVVELSPSTRTLLWWCAAAKFVLALTWTTPIAVPLLPTASAPASTASSRRAVPADTAPANDVWTRITSRVSSRVGPRITSRFAPPRAEVEEGTAASLVTRGWSSLASGVAEWSTFAGLAWLMGLALIGFVAIRRWHETASMMRASVAAPPETQRQAADLAIRLGLSRVPDVRISDRVNTPLVAGFRRPAVLLPAGRFEALTPRQQEMAICHELTHLKRADLWLGCVPALAERLFFFHPIAHVVAREYSLAREAACDAAVVETLDAPPREYGCLLLALGVGRPQAGAAAGAAWSFEHLKRRIAMLQELPSSPHRSRTVAAAAVAVAVLALVPLRLVARPAPGAAVMPGEVAAAQAGRAGRAPRAQGDRAVAQDVRDAELGTAVEAVEQTPRESGPKEMSFVLMLDGQRTVSGSEQDMARARSFQRDGASLLWVRRNGREYVIRDEDVLRQAREAWRDFNKHELGQFVDGHLEAMGKALADSPLIGHAAQAGVEAGRLGAEIGAHAAEIAAEALRHLQFSDLDFEKLKDLKELKELKHLHKLEKLHELHELDALESSMRELHKSLADIDKTTQREIERSFKKALDEHHESLEHLKDRLHDLAEPLREMEHPIRDMAEPLEEMGRHMGEMGREIGRETERAMQQMREIIERAIAAGVAKPVK